MHNTFKWPYQPKHSPSTIYQTTIYFVILGRSHKCYSCGRERVHQAARTQSPHGSMVRRRSYPTTTSRHADRQGCENGQYTSGSGHGVCRQRGYTLSTLAASYRASTEPQCHVERPPPVPCDEAARLFHISVSSPLPHSCEAWTLTRTVMRMINGFNSRCLEAITGEDYRTTATVPAYTLILAVRKRRLRPRPHAVSAHR